MDDQNVLFATVFKNFEFPVLLSKIVCPTRENLFSPGIISPVYLTSLRNELRRKEKSVLL